MVFILCMSLQYTSVSHCSIS